MRPSDNVRCTHSTPTGPTGAASTSPNKKPLIKTINVRPGEKFHEILISGDEIRNTYESSKDYIIYNEVNDPLFEKPKIPYKTTKLKEDYSSENADMLTKNELKNLILKETALSVKEI